MNVYDQLIKAQFENLASDPSTTPTGIVYYNTASDIVKYYDVGATAWRTIVNTDKAQTLSNKTLASPTLTGTILLQNPSGSQPELWFSEDPDNGTNYIAFKAAASMAGNYTLTWPSAAPAGDNYAIVSSTAGVLSFLSVAADVTTTRGDLIRRGATGLERFAAVTNNRVVRGDGTDVVLGQIDSPSFFTTAAAATEAAIGIVTAGVQNFAGVKVFYDGLKLDEAAAETTLNSYQETSTTFTFSGNAGGAASSSITVRLTRIGRLVNIDINACGDAACSGGSTYLVSNTALAAAWRPVAQTYSAPCIVKNNNIEQNSPGRLEILTSGIIRFYFSLDTGTAAFANVSTNGFTHQTATYVGS